MIRSSRVLIWGGMVVVVGAVLAWGSVRYNSRAAALAAQIKEAQGVVNECAKRTAAQGEPARDLGAVGRLSLGSSPETVDARLRAQLNEILSGLGLAKRSVSTRRAEGVVNPALRSRAREFKGWKGDVMGFARATATVSATGTLEQVASAAAVIRSQSWVRRVESVTLTPADAERSRYKLDLALSTALVAGFPGDEAEVVSRPADGALLATWQGVAASNPFKPPAPKPVVAARPPDRPAPVRRADPPRVAPRPPPPYQDWRVQGIADGADGPELWLRNGVSGERQRLLPGDSILELEFVGLTPDGDGAAFRGAASEGGGAGSLFGIALGGTLAERERLNQ